ncbi:hypothetical protein VP01_4043g1, partial [Puccinia sorghi]
LLEAPQYLRNFPPMIHHLCGLWEVVMMLSWIPGNKSTKISRRNQNSTGIKGSLRKLTEAKRIHVEELGPCDIDHWMSMPTTGHPVAEVYNRPVLYYVKSCTAKKAHSTACS